MGLGGPLESRGSDVINVCFHNVIRHSGGADSSRVTAAKMNTRHLITPNAEQQNTPRRKVMLRDTAEGRKCISTSLTRILIVMCGV